MFVHPLTALTKKKKTLAKVNIHALICLHIHIMFNQNHIKNSKQALNFSITSINVQQFIQNGHGSVECKLKGLFVLRWRPIHLQRCVVHFMCLGDPKDASISGSVKNRSVQGKEKKKSFKNLFTCARFLEMCSLYSCWFHVVLKNFQEKFYFNDKKCQET